MPTDGRLLLLGSRRPESLGGFITTNSDAGTVGRITISNPFLILSNGGDVLAQGQQGGADVRIQSNFWLRSSDRPNRIGVDGNLVLDSQFTNPADSGEIANPDFADGLRILNTRCERVKESNATSAFSVGRLGPSVISSAARSRGQLAANLSDNLVGTCAP
jgi:hypothetical protein